MDDQTDAERGTTGSITTTGRLKARLAIKVASVVEEDGLTSDGVASDAGLTVETVEAILEGFVDDIDLGDILLCLISVGLDVQILTTPTRNGAKGEFFLDIDDGSV
jgi:hypothetical protein